jgi:hypothetical protein
MPYVQENELDSIVADLRAEYSGRDFVVGFSGYEPFVTPNCVEPKAGLLLPLFKDLCDELGRPLRYRKSTWNEFPKLIQDDQIDTMLEPIIPRPQYIVLPYMEIVCNVLVVPEGSRTVVEQIAAGMRHATDQLSIGAPLDEYNMFIRQALGTVVSMSKDRRIGVTGGVLEQRILEEFGTPIAVYPPEDIVENVFKAVPDHQFFFADNHSALVARERLVREKGFRTRLVHLFRDHWGAECGFAASATNRPLARYFAYKCRYHLSEIHDLLRRAPAKNCFDGTEFRLLISSETRDYPITRYAHEDMLRLTASRHPLPHYQVVVTGAQQAQLAGPEFDMSSIVVRLRRTWESAEMSSRALHVGLAVLQGIAERMAGSKPVDYPTQQFLRQKAELVETGSADAIAIENEARSLGLPVCDPQEEVTAVDAFFGYVESVTDRKARVILLDDNDRHILDDMIVPSNWLPAAYRSEGSGVAWIERHYASGSKGRFEPGSTVDDELTAS